MTAYLLALLITASPCTTATAVTSPCEGVAVPVADLLQCGTDRADLAACIAHRERERATCAKERAIDAEAAEVREWTLRRERDAARRRADAMAGAGADGPSVVETVAYCSAAVVLGSLSVWGVTSDEPGRSLGLVGVGVSLGAAVECVRRL